MILQYIKKIINDKPRETIDCFTFLRYNLPFLIWWFGLRPFKHIQVISERCLIVTEGMIPLYSVFALKYHITDIVVWYPTQSHYSGKWSNLFCVELPSMSSIWQGSFKYQLEIFGLNRPGPHRHRANARPLGYRCW